VGVRLTCRLCSHLGEVVETQPTLGSNVETVVHKNIHFTVWDLGGQENLRSAWNTYYTGSHAVILVVDSTDEKRMATAKAELFKLLANDLLTTAVLLVFANKQDCKHKLSPAQVTARHTYSNTHAEGRGLTRRASG
jgi:ADP-ribosylation factor-like protein 5B